MTVGVLEVAGVASPEGVPGRLDHLGAGFPRLLHNRVDFLLAAHIVADA